MNTLRTIALATALVAAFCISALAVAPASAQTFYHPRQYAHAARLSHHAAVAASRGHYRRATRLRHHAMRIRTAARHGF